MAEDDTQLIRQVESHLPDLMAIYSDVFQALRKLDRSKYPPDTLQQLDQALEPPTEIEPAKATAILKAILGSTSQDKIHLESFYGAPISGSSSLGSFVDDRLKALGLRYHDFWPFLRAKGWLRPD